MIDEEKESIKKFNRPRTNALSYDVDESISSEKAQEWGKEQLKRAKFPYNGKGKT